LERAKLARFISAVFSEPSPASFARLAEPDVIAELRRAAAALDIEGRIIDTILDSFIHGGANEESYVRLLGHTVRSATPPYELEYRTAEVFQQSQTLADIAGFYRAFNVDCTGPLTERADHLATEWEFLAVLAMKESLAACETDRECCVNAQRAFLEEHAASWMPAFFERIRKADSEAFLACAANLAEAVLDGWCAEFSITLGPKWLELRSISEDDSTITCGAAGAVELGPTLAAAMQESE
jgi:TorA maturation chaperone TorD